MKAFLKKYNEFEADRALVLTKDHFRVVLERRHLHDHGNGNVLPVDLLRKDREAYTVAVGSYAQDVLNKAGVSIPLAGELDNINDPKV